MARSTRPWSSASAARCSPCDEAAPGAGARHLDALRRGLVPHRPKGLSIGNRLINARAETVAERPGFRDAFARGRRCLVPADGFYEWRAGPDHRRGDCPRPYYVAETAEARAVGPITGPL
jgi:putative SOS response-associated peptidase YedK